MSAALLTLWKDRVLEAETEIGLIQDDINAALERRKAIKHDGRKHADTIDREKRELLKKLEAVEAEARELSGMCERTLGEKDRVEAVYVSTLDEYESMHYLVHDIKAEETRYAAREDLETRLQRESLAWAETEHTLRSKLNDLQMQLKAMRRQQAQETEDLEADLAGLEKRLRAERAERAGEVKQQARSAVRSSRQPTPAPAPATTGPSSSAAAAAAALAAINKESSFLAANANGSVPIRGSAAALRSCLKPGNNSSNTTTTNSINSAPVSRAGSQPLVSEGGGGDGAQASLAMMRAYSYGSGKQPSRKRDMLGESTNQQ